MAKDSIIGIINRLISKRLDNLTMTDVVMGTITSIAPYSITLLNELNEIVIPEELIDVDTIPLDARIGDTYRFLRYAGGTRFLALNTNNLTQVRGYANLFKFDGSTVTFLIPTYVRLEYIDGIYVNGALLYENEDYIIDEEHKRITFTATWEPKDNSYVSLTSIQGYSMPLTFDGTSTRYEIPVYIDIDYIDKIFINGELMEEGDGNDYIINAFLHQIVFSRIWQPEDRVFITVASEEHYRNIFNFNGTKTTFIFPNNIDLTKLDKLYVNGILLLEGHDYTINKQSRTITFATAFSETDVSYVTIE